jgi:hypothetical protein
MEEKDGAVKRDDSSRRREEKEYEFAESPNDLPPVLNVMVVVVSNVKSCTPLSVPDTTMSTPRAITADGSVMEPRLEMVRDAESRRRAGE